MTRDSAALIGAVLSAMISTISVLLACARPTWQLIRARWHGTFASVSDQLFSGIFLVSFGALEIQSLIMVKHLVADVATMLFVLGWSTIATGNVLIFAAWRSSYLAKRDGFLVHWIMFLLALGGVAAAAALLLAAG